MKIILKKARRQAYLNAAHALKTQVNLSSAKDYLKARYVNAIDSAIRLQEKGFVVTKEVGHFAVQSEHGEHSYALNLNNGKITCNCPAGQTGMPCKHAALLALSTFVNERD